MKLFRARGIRRENRAHFYAVCAQVIRRIRVNHARKRRYAKRGGDSVQVPLNEDMLKASARGDVLSLDEALASLSKIDPRKGRVAELRNFSGLSVDETAEVLGISPTPPCAIGSWPRRGFATTCERGDLAVAVAAKT